MLEYWSRMDAAFKAKFKSEVDHFPLDTQRTLKRAKKAGCWLSVMHSHVSGTTSLSTEFYDALMLQYDRIYLRTYQLGNLAAECLVSDNLLGYFGLKVLLASGSLNVLEEDTKQSI